MGASGAGKSTIRKNLREQGRYEYPENFYDIDEMKKEYGDVNDPESYEKARAELDRIIDNHVENRETFGFETVFSNPERIEAILKIWERGYDLAGIFACTGDVKINNNRVRERYQSGGHDVPVKAIIRDHHLSIVNLVENYEKFSRIIFYDTRDVARIVGHGREGTLHIDPRLPETPDWFSPFEIITGEDQRMPSPVP